MIVRFILCYVLTISEEEKRREIIGMSNVYNFQAVIEPVPEKSGAFVRVPYDIRTEFGKGRLKVHAWFDDVPYDGSIVNMGVRNADGSICYILGVRKDIRKKIGKDAGDLVDVKFEPII
jgi:hypothetical protein